VLLLLLWLFLDVVVVVGGVARVAWRGVAWLLLLLWLWLWLWLWFLLLLLWLLSLLLLLLLVVECRAQRRGMASLSWI
jgi:hypothetical protein